MLTKEEFEIMNNAPKWANVYHEFGGNRSGYSESCYGVSHDTVFRMSIGEPTLQLSLSKLRKMHKNDLLIIKDVFRARGNAVNVAMGKCITEMSNHAGKEAFDKYTVDLQQHELSKQHKKDRVLPTIKVQIKPEPEEIKITYNVINNDQSNTKKESKMQEEYVEIENPNIFKLEDDWEGDKLYTNDKELGFQKIHSLYRLVQCVQQDLAIHRKQHWTDKLDGTEENAILCHVWDDYCFGMGEHILGYVVSADGGRFACLGKHYTWYNAKPAPQSVIDFINRK